MHIYNVYFYIICLYKYFGIDELTCGWILLQPFKISHKPPSGRCRHSVWNIQFFGPVQDRRNSWNSSSESEEQWKLLFWIGGTIETPVQDRRNNWNSGSGSEKQLKLLFWIGGTIVLHFRIVGTTVSPVQNQRNNCNSSSESEEQLYFQFRIGGTTVSPVQNRRNNRKFSGETTILQWHTTSVYAHCTLFYILQYVYISTIYCKFTFYGNLSCISYKLIRNLHIFDYLVKLLYLKTIH